MPRSPRKFALIFALAGFRICRDWQNACRLWKHFDALPPNVQKLARDKYALWKRDPHHSSLHFEERRNGICVVRIGDHYRALGLRETNVIAWFWIGTHEEYNRFRF